MTLTPPPPDRFLRLPDVQSAVGLRRAMIYRTIAEGRFQVNAGAIADSLIATARQLIESQRREG